MRKLISIYKSHTVEELYLYVEKAKGMSLVPEDLKEKMGRLIHVSDMILEPTRRMARADAKRVLEVIEERGFYLQLPPVKEDYLLDLYKDTSAKYEGLA